jgi:lysylphosphatidylglycerol synthetase-like protein (DUF2156 family)
MINGFPLSFFLPLVVHALAGLTTGVTGVAAFHAPKRRGRHHRWGKYYLWAYTVVFFTATILSVQRWATDAYLFFLALAGYGFALTGYAARRFRREPSLARWLGKQWVVAHIVGMIGSYIVLWTAFYVDNAHLIPGLNQLPPLAFWVLPSLIGVPFIIVSTSRFVPNRGAPSSRSPSEMNTVNEEAGDGLSSREEEKV